MLLNHRFTHVSRLKEDEGRYCGGEKLMQFSLAKCERKTYGDQLTRYMLLPATPVEELVVSVLWVL